MLHQSRYLLRPSRLFFSASRLRASSSEKVAEAMGMIMGKTASQESGLAPKHDVLGSGTSYEIRAYAPYLVAEVEAGKDVRTEDRFKVLAKYIGVFGNPANKAGGESETETISMTTPVVEGSPSSDSGTKISMTTPVVQPQGGIKTLQFIMPQKYKSLSDLPEPTDDRVSLRAVPEHVYLVRQFSGSMGEGEAYDKAAESERKIAEEGTKKDGGAFSEYVGTNAKFSVARYNPPFTLPFLKTNELWFPLPLSRAEAIAKLPSA